MGSLRVGHDWRDLAAAVTISVTLIVFFTFSKQSSDDEDGSAKGRNRHILINKAELANSIEVLESFKLARESWELLYSLEFLDKGKAYLSRWDISVFIWNHHTKKDSLFYSKCQVTNG